MIKGKYVVKRLNDKFEFVHNNEDNSNWFNQKTLASMFGVSVVNVSRFLNTYSKRINEFNNFLTKPIKVHIKLKIDNTKQLTF